MNDRQLKALRKLAGNPADIVHTNRDYKQQDAHIRDEYQKRVDQGSVKPYLQEAMSNYDRDPVKRPGMALNSEPFELKARNAARGTLNGISRTLTGGVVRVGDYADNIGAKLWGESNADGSRIGFLGNAETRLRDRYDNFLRNERPSLSPEEHDRALSWYNAAGSVPQAGMSIASAAATGGIVPGSYIQATGNTAQAGLDAVGGAASGRVGSAARTLGTFAEPVTDSISRLSLATSAVPAGLRTAYRIPATAGAFTLADSAAAIGRGDQVPNIVGTAIANVPMGVLYSIPGKWSYPAIAAYSALQSGAQGMSDSVANKFPALAPYLEGSPDSLERLREQEERLRQQSIEQGEDPGSPSSPLSQAQRQLQYRTAAQYYTTLMPELGSMSFESQEQLQKYIDDNMQAIPADTRYKVLNSLVSQGGQIPPELLDPGVSGLTEAQTDDLYKGLLATEHDKYSGKSPLLPGFMDRVYDDAKLWVKDKSNKGGDVIAELSARNPAFRGATVTYMSSKISSALSADSGNQAGADAKQQAYLAKLPADMRAEVFDKAVAELPQGRLADIIQSTASGDTGQSSINPTLAADAFGAVIRRAGTDSEFLEKDFIPALDAYVQRSGESHSTPEERAAFVNTLMANKEAVASVLGDVTENHSSLLLKLLPALSEQGGDSGLPGVDAKAFEDFKNDTVIPAAKKGIWNAVKADPVKNLPTAFALLFKAKGWNGVAGWLEDPMKFWLTAGLLLTGGIGLAGALSGGAPQPQPAPVVVNYTGMPSAYPGSGTYLQALNTYGV